MTLRIEDLIARGRTAHLAAMRRRYSAESMPFGVDSLHVVTARDFDAYPALCRRYAARSRSFYVLDDDDMIELLMCRSRVEG